MTGRQAGLPDGGGDFEVMLEGNFWPSLGNNTNWYDVVSEAAGGEGVAGEVAKIVRGQLDGLGEGRGAALVPTCALRGLGVQALLKAIVTTHASWCSRASTGKLNAWVSLVMRHHPLHRVHQRHLQLRAAQWHMDPARHSPALKELQGSQSEAACSSCCRLCCRLSLQRHQALQRGHRPEGRRR